MSNNSYIIPVILCGGIGSRLWPLSRTSYPKQFLNINKDSGKSMLQETQARLTGFDNIDSPIIICNEEHRFIVAEQMRDINVKPKAIILEPEGRNTAPAITISALKIIEENKNGILLVLSADHKISDSKKFLKAINYGFDYAKRGKLITFGVMPSYPETGYGYIESEKTIKKNNFEAVNISRFIEKPNYELACNLLKDKKFTWNSGIFIFKANIVLEEIKKNNLNLFDLCKLSLEKSNSDLDFIRLEKSSFLNCPNISIDVAVMEKTNLGAVIPLDAGWSDIGSWKSLWDNETKDDNGNVISGKIITKDSKDCYLRSENRLIVALGMENSIIVETSDAILIANKDHSKSVKSIVNELKIKGWEEGAKHRKIFRPWGNYTSVVEDFRWQVKKIEVKAGSKLSLQMHHHRAEHWIVVSGTAEVEIEDKTVILSENQSAYIPIASKHRLSNPGKIPLILIEVQSGAYLGEDDIERFDDIYGRDK